MSLEDRGILNAKIAELLHMALVAIRATTFPAQPGENDRRPEVNDLADLLHNLPRYIVGHDEYAIDSLEQLRAAVISHVQRFCPNIKPEQHRYVELLDMDTDTFVARYKHHQWMAPEATA